MNYFAHGRLFIDDPYFLAGTAVPDWLNVVDRKMRVRSKSAAPFADDDCPAVSALARGIVRHHHDDDWFHQTRAFAELSLQFTLEIRDLLADEAGFRPSFLGHILVELLLDAELTIDDQAALDEYYRALSQVDVHLVETAVNKMATRSSHGLSDFIPRFCHERFLCDYADDGKLLWRLNQVMRRVGLPQLPDAFLNLLPSARERVAERRGELLAEDEISDSNIQQETRK